MTLDKEKVVLIAGSSHPALAKEIAGHLGLPLARRDLVTFPDGEISLQILDSVRGRDVFIMQSVAIDPNFYLMELLVMIDALKRASARSIIPVIPYFGYCRQDRKDKPRVPITAKLVTNLIETAGATRVVTMDLHAKQVQGFFDIPVDNLYGRPQIVTGIRSLGLSHSVVVTPDMGSIKLARDFATQLGADIAIIDKRRMSAKQVEVTTLIGDVDGRDVVLVDDMCSTGGTLMSAAEVCRERGAKRIFAAVTHGLFVGDAIEKLDASSIEKMIVGDTVPFEDHCTSSKIKKISVANLFGDAIKCIVTGRSISSLFELAALSS